MAHEVTHDQERHLYSIGRGTLSLVSGRLSPFEDIVQGKEHLSQVPPVGGEGDSDVSVR